ncbi:hypothetical protein HZS_2842, partial [Henneguya salminicola]
MGTLQKSNNHIESQIKYDSQHNVIYILTYQKTAEGVVKDSTLYSSMLTDSFFTPIELKHEFLDVQFTKIVAGPEIIVGISNIKDLIAISTNFGKDWKMTFQKLGDVKEIFISPHNSHQMVIVNNRNTIFFMTNLGEKQRIPTYYGTKLMWSSNSEFLYLLAKSFSNNNLSLIKTHNDLYMPSVVFEDAIDYGEIGKNIWVIHKDEHKSHLYFIESDEVVKKAHFPEFLKPTNFYLFSSNSQIYTIVTNETNNILLYIASLKDLKFVRIGENIRSSYMASMEPCISVETFEHLPGVLIMNIEKIATGNKSPSLMISYGRVINYMVGIIYRNEVEDYSGIFISLDAGYSWKQIPRPINSVYILNYGSILLGLPNILNSLYYSFDLGHTWTYMILDGNSSIPIKIFPDSTSSSLLTTIITFNDNNKEWGFIKIDFTKTLKNDCDPNNYETYTPGLHDKFTCFQGQKGFSYRRKHDVKCKSVLDKFPQISPSICPCTQDDFGCTFGHHFINGICLKDLDNNENEILDMCVPGEFSLMPSIKKKLDGDICESNEKWSDQESDICKFTALDKSISVLTGSTIKYIYFNGDGKTDLINLPIDLTHISNIKSYSLNFHLRCLYVLNESGIIRFCYNKKELAYENLEEIFLKDHSILGMRLDQTSNNIFYNGLKNIFVVNTISKYRKIIYRSLHDITYINLFPTLGLILYTYIKTDLVPNKYCVNFLSMMGENKSNLCFNEPILTVANNVKNKQFFIYLKDSVSIVDYNYELVKKKVAKTQDIIEAYVDGFTEYFITKNGIFFEEKAFYNSHITHGYFHFVQKSDRNSPCLLAHCDIFCLTTSSISYECDCPNNMVFNKIIFKCVCDASHPDCTACKSNEYHCKNEKCVPMSNRCNGVDNCGDSSDEQNCKMICEIDELLCDNDSNCVDYYDICDGVEHCKDGKDELNCHKAMKNLVSVIEYQTDELA